nr:tetratricopeptide repeat protein [uncultured Mucilaginibacter sp.]
MKPTLSLIVLFGCALAGFSQSTTNASLKFDKNYTRCERRWVVLTKADTAKAYGFGFIYIDEQAGFTYDLKGNLTIDDKGVYKADTTIFKGQSIKLRIPPNWQKVALLPPDKIKALNLQEEPYWIKKFYYNYTDTVKHNYRWGWIYNDLGESAIAITYLEPAYRINKYAKGVAFELGFAYNVVNRFSDAVGVLEQAVLNKPDDSFLYKELGYAYLHLNQYEKAIDTYKRGLDNFPAKDKVSDAKGELAINMAIAYKT